MSKLSSGGGIYSGSGFTDDFDFLFRLTGFCAFVLFFRCGSSLTDVFDFLFRFAPPVAALDCVFD